MTISGYYYLHVNNSLIYKPYDEGRVADFRESDMVRAFWPMNPSDRENAWTILVEGMAAGADRGRVKELAEKWQCNDEDAEIYAERVGITLFMDGDKWCATGPGFINLQEFKAGFGDTCLEAMANLAKDLGYKPSKMWGHSFHSLLQMQDPASKQHGVGA